MEDVKGAALAAIAACFLMMLFTLILLNQTRAGRDIPLSDTRLKMINRQIDRCWPPCGIDIHGLQMSPYGPVK
jgi:Na+-driven multidrug efflux pump